MRPLFISLLIVGLAATRSSADDPPPPKALEAPGSFETIKKEFKEATAKFSAERRAKKNQNAPVRPGEGPYLPFSVRFLAFAEQHPQDPAAIDAVNLALRSSLFSGEQGQFIWNKAVALLRKSFVTNPDIKKVFLWLSVRNHDTASEDLLREIIARNPDRIAQGEACQTLVRRAGRDAEVAELLRDDSESRKRFEAREGKAKLEQELAKIEPARKAADQLREAFRPRYAEFFPTIAIGQPAPELISRDIEGNTVRLSDLKGKVVVLDVWTTWCGPCRAMIPHERAMVKRKLDKPFALVSISCDEEMKALTDFLAKEPMPWQHWWNGQNGGIMSAWKIRAYPTIYVLDSNGVLRYKDLHDDALEKVVDELLAETLVKPAA